MRNVMSWIKKIAGGFSYVVFLVIFVAVLLEVIFEILIYSERLEEILEPNLCITEWMLSQFFWKLCCDFVSVVMISAVNRRNVMASLSGLYLCIYSDYGTTVNDINP